MRRPLIGLAAAGMAGTVAGLLLRPPPPILLASCMLLWLPLVVRLFTPGAAFRPVLASAALLALTAGLAALLGTLAASPVSPADLRKWLPDHSVERVMVSGVVSGDPYPVQDRGPYSLRFPMRVESLKADSNAPSRAVRGQVMVTWVNPRPVPPPAYGERWSVKGLATVKESVRFRAGPFGARFQERRQGDPFRQFCERQRKQAMRLLSVGIDDHPAQAGLLQALMVGSRIRLTTDVKQDFMATGTFHVIAISGLHVGMMAWLLASVLRVLGINRVWWFPILAPLLIVYTMGTGASASALRACIMSCLFYAATLVGRKPDAPSALAASALLIAALDPWQVLDRGFILSFCLVGGLLLVAPLLTRATPAFLKPDPFQTADLVPKWKKLLYEAVRAVWSTLILSAAAWFTSLPISTYFFGNVSTVALLGNLVAIPASFLVVLAGSLSVVFGSVWLVLAEIFNYANLALITALVTVLGWLGSLPYAYVTLPRPPLWFVFAWYAALAWLVTAYRNRASSALASESF